MNLAILWDWRQDSARALYLYRQFLELVRADDPDRPSVEARVALLEPLLLKLPGAKPD